MGFFFFPSQMSLSWRVDDYWELCYCFSLVQEFLWRICLYIFFPCGNTWGDSTLFSASPCLWWFFSPFFEDYPSAAEPLSYAAGSSAVQEGPWALLRTSYCFLLARDLTRQETAQRSVCPCKLFKKKFNPGLVSCDLAIDWIRIYQNNITPFCTLGYDTVE